MIVFIQWSTPIIYKFVDEEEAIEFQKRKGHTFPDITICPRQSYFNWLFKNFVCVATNVHIHKLFSSCLTMQQVQLAFIV